MSEAAATPDAQIIRSRAAPLDWGVGRAAAQIESSLLLLSRAESGFLRCGFEWACPAGLSSGS
jgi:hypothetical protein